MCIIITKEHGAKPLPIKYFENAWDNNPDGGGILFNDGKTTTLIKGIMEKEEFLKKVKTANRKECSFIIHTRIATHGSVKPENTHPFVSKTLGFAHNGTMNIHPLEDKTDSESFFLWSIADKTFKWCKDNKFLLDMATDGSRCVVFDMITGELLHLCDVDWKTNKNHPGCMFSNESYLYTYTYKIKATDNCGMGTAAFDDWDDLDDWRRFSKTNQYNKSSIKYTPENIYEITTEMLEIDKKGNFRCVDSWVIPFLDSYAEKTDTSIPNITNEMKDTLWKMGCDCQDCQMYDGKEQFSTQAIAIMYSFYKTAQHKGYHDVTQVNNAFKEFIKEIKIDTEADEKIVKELETLRQEWR